MAGTATGQGSRAPFEARTARVSGTIALNASIEEVFPLFSPLGEKRWVDGWDPEIVWPRDADWRKG